MRLVRLQLVEQTLVFGELADEVGDGRGIAGAGGSDDEAHTATGALIWGWAW